MPAVLDASGEKVETPEQQLSRIENDIEAVKRRKLITIVSPGGPDKVLFVEPLDLRGKDPDEDISVIEDYVIETKWDNGFAQHITGKRDSGNKRKRGPSGLFGPTYKIDTGNQNGEREFQEFKRVLETHTSRLLRVPDPVAYHTEVNNEGHLDLRNITLRKEDVPVAMLENYEPLIALENRRDVLRKKLGLEAVEEKTPEAVKVEETEAKIHKCDECGVMLATEVGIRLHKGKFHKKEE